MTTRQVRCQKDSGQSEPEDVVWDAESRVPVKDDRGRQHAEEVHDQQSWTAGRPAVLLAREGRCEDDEGRDGPTVDEVRGAHETAEPPLHGGRPRHRRDPEIGDVVGEDPEMAHAVGADAIEALPEEERLFPRDVISEDVVTTPVL